MLCGGRGLAVGAFLGTFQGYRGRPAAIVRPPSGSVQWLAEESEKKVQGACGARREMPGTPQVAATAANCNTGAWCVGDSRRRWRRRAALGTRLAALGASVLDVAVLGRYLLLGPKRQVGVVATKQ